MKAMKRRLLSLFMAMVMVLSLAPAALAEGDEPDWTDAATTTQWSGGTLTESHTAHSYGDSPQWAAGTAATCTTGATRTTTCTSEGCGATATQTSKPLGHTAASGWTSNGTKHWHKCERTGCDAHLDEADHVRPGDGITWVDKSNHKYTCTTCKKTDVSEGHTWAYVPSTSDATKHIKYCSVCSIASDTAHTTSENHTWENGKCKFCKADDPASNYTITISGDSTVRKGSSTSFSAVVKNGDQEITSPNLSWSSKDPSIATVNASTGEVTGKAVGTATIEVKFTDSVSNITKTATKSIEVINPFWIDSNPSHATLSRTSDELILTAYLNNSTKVTDVTWSVTSGKSYFEIDNDNYDNGKCIVIPRDTSTSKVSGTISAKAEVDGVTYTAEKTVYLDISTDISLSATVSTDYYFEEVGEASSDKYSVEDQLDNYISDKLSTKSDKRYLEEVWFTSKTDTTYGYLSVDKDEDIDAADFGDVLFTPKAKGKATFDFSFSTVNENGKDRTKHTGTLTITVTDASSSSGDVTFYGEVGEDVSFDSASFEDFWDDKYSGGDLDYVTFSVSGGTLRDVDGKSVGSKSCYVSPRKTNIGLDEVYFEPSSTNSKKATTITFSFTAYGEDKKGNEKEASGRVSIVYMSDSPKDITYTAGTNGTVSLKASDFTAAYKEVISGSVPSNLTIVFQGAPKNGTLTYNDSSKKNAKDVTLTNSNIKKYSFTTKSSGTNQLNDITYSGTSGTDTIEYTAYSGSTPKFKGQVVFNGKAAVPTDVVVGPFYSTAGQPAAFSQNTFTAASSAMSNAVKVRFVAPANGTLTMSGASAAGTDIAVSLLNLVSYQPKAGYNGTDQIIFAAYDAKNAVVASGTVNVQVIGNPTTTTPTTPGGSTGVTSVDEFKDVPNTQGNAWYRSNLDALVKKGVISGRGNGVFDPKGTVTYGEALKMVLEACGHSPAPQTGHWANKYKSFAVSQGWISSEVNVDAVISRNAIADLVGKVLGVAPATSSSPFADSASAYAVALYYTTPQIFKGNPNNGGKPLFKGESSLSRAEVCVVIYQVMDYHTQHTTNTMPDGT